MSGQAYSEKRVALICQAHLLFCPIEKLDTEFLFQPFDLARERRLCEVQHYRGLGEAKRFGHGDEVMHVTNLHSGGIPRV